MANHSPRTSAQDSNVLIHPTALNAPVVIARRPGRLPSNVTALSKVRIKKTVAQKVAPDSKSQSYSDRRAAAEEAVKQGPDAALFEEFELLNQVIRALNTKVWSLKHSLLYRIDPELEQLGQIRGRQC